MTGDAAMAAAEFDRRGHRGSGEIDLDNRQIGTKISEMTAEAAEADRRWRAEHRS